MTLALFEFLAASLSGITVWDFGRVRLGILLIKVLLDWVGWRTGVGSVYSTIPALYFSLFAIMLAVEFDYIFVGVGLFTAKFV